jgi:hypothetical protein
MPAETPNAPPPRGWLTAIRHEIVTHPLVYTVMAAFCVIGPVLTWMIFPEASLGLIVFGGIALGVVFSLCALAGRVLD